LTRPVSTPALESPEIAVSPAQLNPEGRERIQENPPLNRGYAQPNERTGERDNSEENCFPPEDIKWGAESTDMDWTSYRMKKAPTHPTRTGPTTTEPLNRRA